MFSITSLKILYTLVFVFALNKEMIFTNALKPNLMRAAILTVIIAAPRSRPNFIDLPAIPVALKNLPATD